MREIVQLDSGEIWFAERFHGVRRLRSMSGGVPDSVPGLPSNSVMVKLALLGGVPTAFPDDDPHAYRYASSTGRFEVFRPLGNDTSRTVPEAVGIGPSGDVWKVFADSVEWWRPYLHDGYQRSVPSLLSLPIQKTDIVHVDQDGIIWYNSNRGIVRYDPAVSKDYSARFFTRIRSVESALTKTVVRANISEAGIAGQYPHGIIEMPFEDKAIVIRYSIAHFNQPELATFRYRLVGLSDEWSPWESSTATILNDLNPGEYTFEVEGRNAHGFTGVPARFAFVILPPWYMTPWAYAMFVLGAIAILGLAAHYRRLYRSHRLASLQAEELAREREYVQRLTEANEELRKANRMRDEFLATTSHELRTPLTAMLSSVEILKLEISPDAEASEFLDIIEESGTRLTNTLRDMLDIARIRSATMQLAPTTVDVGELIARVVRRYDRLAGAKAMSIRVQSPSDGVTALLDEEALDRIVDHILSNAVKFTEHGSVGVELLGANGTVCIAIRDTGPGIDSEIVPHIFEEFRQGSDGEARLFSGNGLGLSIAAGLVRLMGGDISVSTMKGVGSVFSVTIPDGVNAIQLPEGRVTQKLADDRRAKGRSVGGKSGLPGENAGLNRSPR